MKYLFIYNAQSGKLNALLHSAHKMISPSTYQCSLCALTFGNFSEANKWKDFRKSLSCEVIFLHKDEFERQYQFRYEYPVVLSMQPPIEQNGLKIIVDTHTLNQTENLDALIALCKQRLV